MCTPKMHPPLTPRARPSGSVAATGSRWDDWCSGLGRFFGWPCPLMPSAPSVIGRPPSAASYERQSKPPESVVAQRKWGADPPHPKWYGTYRARPVIVKLFMRRNTSPVSENLFPQHKLLVDGWDRHGRAV